MEGLDDSSVRARVVPRPSWMRSRLMIGTAMVGHVLGGAALLASPPALAAGTGYAPTSPTVGGTAMRLPGSVRDVSVEVASG
jgi:hypothetical protein